MIWLCEEFSSKTNHYCGNLKNTNLIHLLELGKAEIDVFTGSSYSIKGKLCETPSM